MSRWLSGRPVMKSTATPFAFAASNSFRAGSIALALPLRIHWIEPARTLRRHVAGAVGDETEIVCHQIWPVGQRRLIDIEHQRRPLRLGGVLLDIFFPPSSNTAARSVIVVLVMIVAQQRLDGANIEWCRGGGSRIWSSTGVGQASGAAAAGLPRSKTSPPRQRPSRPRRRDPCASFSTSRSLTLNPVT